MPEQIRRILGKHGRSPDELIPILQDVQAAFGYIGEPAVKAISRYLRISENQIYGVSSFYAQFRFTEPGRHGIKVCLGTACHVRGGGTLLDSLEHGLGISCGETTEDKRFDVDRVACLGCCALSPVVQIDRDIYSRMTVNKLTELLKNYE
ncbi:MAG: NAD(P)H-dependent oxidoreductase subunit E [Syntrophorhabdus sp.]|jgi:NADH:ubiquinone oxidoreductase subunit E|nr:NAD(P)H-dependent oxidoreductase subunit E [Syntrophorhabdus sp.]